MLTSWWCSKVVLNFNVKKMGHWIWFVFPQMQGLGYSYNSNYYGITCREEAEAYLVDDTLNGRIRKVCKILLEHVMAG